MKDNIKDNINNEIKYLRRQNTVSDFVTFLNKKKEINEEAKNSEIINKPLRIDSSSIIRRVMDMKNQFISEKKEKMKNLNKKNEFYKEKNDQINVKIDSAIEKRHENLRKVNEFNNKKKYVHEDILNKTFENRESIKTIVKNIQLENWNKNSKIQSLSKQIIQNVYGNNDKEKNKLTFQNKLRLFDRKINNCEKKEKMKLNIELKNPNLTCKYEIKIYDENQNLIGKSDKLNEKNYFIFDKNLIVDYDFTKDNTIKAIIKKFLSGKKEKIAEKRIFINKIFKTKNYEMCLTNLDENEKISIEYDDNYDEKKEDFIQIYFNNNNDVNDNNKNNVNNGNKNQNEKISYTIQKNGQIIYKSAFCKYNYLKETDKLPIDSLKPKFEISFYNQNFDEKKIEINVDDLKNGFPAPIVLPNTESLNLNIKSEKKEIIPIHKLFKKGLNLKLSIAIDFTGSNGSPRWKDSLHYIDGKEINNYEKAMKSIFKIIFYYTENEDCDVYGFGANVNGRFKQIFNINGKEDPNINGTKNIIDEYRKTVKSVDFSGGSYIAPAINEVNNKIKKNPNKLNYHLLFIITDGAIDDIKKSIDSAIESSKLPLSIVIFGVGDYVNKDMKLLNRENGKIISSKNEELKKDIIQYVHFKDYADDFDKLNEAVLKYIPQQVSDYYYSSNQSI